MLISTRSIGYQIEMRLDTLEIIELLNLTKLLLLDYCCNYDRNGQIDFL